MNIFNVHNQVIEEYSKYISSFLDISNTRIKEAVEEYFKSRKLWPQPLLQFNPSYELSEPIIFAREKYFTINLITFLRI